VAYVVAVFDDLLLGSNVLEMIRAAGHEAELVTPARAPSPGSRMAREGPALIARLLSAGEKHPDKG
jgi:hypothetical protein